MLPRRSRLTRAAFSNTGKEMRAVSPHFSVSIRETETTGIAAIISKKVEKTSVGRHLLKRRMMGVAREWCATPHAVMIYARTGAGSLPYAELKKELHALLARLLGAPSVR